MTKCNGKVGCPFTDFSRAHARFSTFPGPGLGRVAQKPIFRAVVISVVKSVVTVVHFSNFCESQERCKSIGRGVFRRRQNKKNCRLAEKKMK